MSYELRSARWIAADVLRQVVQPGDTVVDATLGNGHDTLMLCELVGETGRVIGFDIQPDAVERTRERPGGCRDAVPLHTLRRGARASVGAGDRADSHRDIQSWLAAGRRQAHHDALGDDARGDFGGFVAADEGRRLHHLRLSGSRRGPTRNAPR